MSMRNNNNRPLELGKPSSGMFLLLQVISVKKLIQSFFWGGGGGVLFTDLLTTANDKDL